MIAEDQSSPRSFQKGCSTQWLEAAVPAVQRRPPPPILELGYDVLLGKREFHLHFFRQISARRAELWSQAVESPGPAAEVFNQLFKCRTRFSGINCNRAFESILDQVNDGL